MRNRFRSNDDHYSTRTHRLFYEFMGASNISERNPFSNFETRPTGLERAIQILGCRYFCLRRKIVAAKEEDADVFENHHPKRNLRIANIRSISSNRSAHLQQIDISSDVRRKRYFHDVIDAFWGEGFHARDKILIVTQNFMGARVFRNSFIRPGPNCADHVRSGEAYQLNRTQSYGTCCALHQDSASPYIARDMNGPVRGYAGNAETCALIHRSLVGEGRNVIERHYGEFRSGA